MRENIEGEDNIALGTNALYANQYGFNNIAIGNSALDSALSVGNVGIGTLAGSGITLGQLNVAIGYGTQQTLNATGNYNIVIGASSYTSALVSNAIVIGYNINATGSNTVTIGNASITKTYLRGTLNILTLPTSATGLVTGDLWRNGNVVNIIP